MWTCLTNPPECSHRVWSRNGREGCSGMLFDVITQMVYIKISSTFWEQGGRSAKLRRFPATPFFRSILEKQWETSIWETANFCTTLYRKAIQLSDFDGIFDQLREWILSNSFHAPAGDLLEVELYEETKKSFSSKMQFWPYIHALTYSAKW